MKTFKKHKNLLFLMCVATILFVCALLFGLSQATQSAYAADNYSSSVVESETASDNTINKSNILVAINDHALHVSIRPNPPTPQSLTNWCETYDFAETAQTIYSVFLKNVVIRIF